MSRTIIISILVVAAAAAACEVQPEESASPGIAGPWPGADMPSVPQLVMALDEIDSLQQSSEPDVCSCSTQTCFEDWVREHVGCDVCVVLQCEDDATHICVLCPQPPPPADSCPSRRTAAGSPCGSVADQALE